MAEPALAQSATAPARTSLGVRERRALRSAAATLFLHDPSILELDDLLSHPAVREGLNLCAKGSLQRWAAEDDWAGAKKAADEQRRRNLQRLVGDANLERQRAHIEQLTKIYNGAGKQLETLRPKSYEQMMQLRLRALELLHTWEGDLLKANLNTLPADKPADNEDRAQPTVIDRMSDAQVRNLFGLALNLEKKEE